MGWFDDKKVYEGNYKREKNFVIQSRHNCKKSTKIKKI
jgi:hypothetical protein